MADESAICCAIDGATRWVFGSGYRNVLIEINNKANIPQYEYETLHPYRIAELIARAKSIELDDRQLLVGTSYVGGYVPDNDVVAVSDYIMLYGNGVTKSSRIAEMMQETRALPSYIPKPDLIYRGR